MGENFTARIFKFFEPSVFFEFLKDNAIKILRKVKKGEIHAIVGENGA